MGQHIIIVGAGQAACSLAAKYRALDEVADITIIGEERHLPYQRPPLSKKYATGEMAVDSLFLRPVDWYVKNNIQCITGCRVLKIDPKLKTVKLDDDRILTYNKLALTTGARPREFPKAIGGSLKGVYLVRGIDDVDGFIDELVEGQRALIIGGGYIGLEAAAVLNKAGLQVRVVEMAERILQRVACEKTSDYFRNLHAEKGVVINENLGVTRLLESNGRVVGAEFSDGSRTDLDFILVGIGVIANDELAKEAGLAVDNGILVDVFGQTSEPDIYAAGDCTRFKYQDQSIQLESVQNAVDQAESVACNMAGEKSDYQPMPWFWSDQYDVKLQIAGLNLDYTDTVVRAGARPGSQSIWYFHGNWFVSVDAMNDPRSFMVGKKLLATGKSINPDQAADTQFDLKSLLN